MGECGCGSSSIDMAMLEMPDGILIISIYPGCDGCERTVFVEVCKASKEEAEFRCSDPDVKNLQSLEIDGDFYAFPVVGWEEIGKAITKEKFADIDEYNSFEDFWHDNQEHIRDAVHETVKKFWEDEKERTTKDAKDTNVQ